MVKKLILEKKISDKKIAEDAGKFFNTWEYLIDYDCDIYNDKNKLLLKFRKNVICKKICNTAFDCYKEVGFKISKNRGDASGRYKNGNKQYRKWSKKGKIYESSDVSNSGIIGYMDSLNWRRPCRETAFTKNYYDKYMEGLPFIKHISKQYQNLLPEYYNKQYKESKKSNMIIDDTVFSTVTINANFRTALHKDSGDFKGGFGNLSIIECGEYEGGYTLLPQYGIAVDVRTTDVLLMDVHEWHCNSEIKQKSKDCVRLAFVCYLRSKMHNCKMLEGILKGQEGMTTAEKINKMMGDKKTKKNLGKGRFGHQWYSYDNDKYNIKYYNKVYTINNKKTKKKYNSITIAYKDFLES
jgi:hypothetical protein